MIAQVYLELFQLCLHNLPAMPQPLVIGPYEIRHPLLIRERACDQFLPARRVNNTGRGVLCIALENMYCLGIWLRDYFHSANAHCWQVIQERLVSNE